MKLVELLNRVNAVYDDGYLGNYYDHTTGARVEGSGDTLAEFIVVELSETFDAAATDEVQLEEAARALTTAKRQLEECINALR